MDAAALMGVVGHPNLLLNQQVIGKLRNADDSTVTLEGSTNVSQLLALIALADEGRNVEVVVFVIGLYRTLDVGDRAIFTLRYRTRGGRCGRSTGHGGGGRRRLRTLVDHRIRLLVDRCRPGMRDGLRRGVHPLAMIIMMRPETGGDDCDLDLVLHALIEYRSKDDVGVLMGSALNDARGFVDFRQFERTGAGNVDEDAARTVDGTRLQ